YVGLEDSVVLLLVFFFFQAEDGIRDFHVTGVQTCALPISVRDNPVRRELVEVRQLLDAEALEIQEILEPEIVGSPAAVQRRSVQIGRASCRKECRDRLYTDD